MAPEFSFTIAYVLYILAVTFTSLLMIVLGGWIMRRLQRGGLRFSFANKTTLHRKFYGFLLFIIAIFLTGWLSERLQATIFRYLMQNAATSFTGLAVTFLIAWVMYDWLVWRKHH